MARFECDPEDGRPTFMPVEFENLDITSLQDVATFWNALIGSALAATDEAGYVIYPFYKLEQSNA